MTTIRSGKLSAVAGGRRGHPAQVCGRGHQGRSSGGSPCRRV